MTYRLREGLDARRSHVRSRDIANGAVLYTTRCPDLRKREILHEPCGRARETINSLSNDGRAGLIGRFVCRRPDRGALPHLSVSIRHTARGPIAVRRPFLTTDPRGQSAVVEIGVVVAVLGGIAIVRNCGKRFALA